MIGYIAGKTQSRNKAVNAHMTTRHSPFNEPYLSPWGLNDPAPTFSQSTTCTVLDSYDCDADGNLILGSGIKEYYNLAEPDKYRDLFNEFKKITNRQRALRWMEHFGHPADTANVDEIVQAAKDLAWLSKLSHIADVSPAELNQWYASADDVAWGEERIDLIASQVLQARTMNPFDVPRIKHLLVLRGEAEYAQSGYATAIEQAETVVDAKYLFFSFTPRPPYKFWAGFSGINKEGRFEPIAASSLVQSVPRKSWANLLGDTKTQAFAQCVLAKLFLKKVIEALLTSVTPAIQIEIDPEGFKKDATRPMNIKLLPRRKVTWPYEAMCLALYEEVTGVTSYKLCEWCQAGFHPARSDNRFCSSACKQKNYNNKNKSGK